MSRRAGSVLVATSVAIIGLDQATKALVRSTMSVGLSVPVVPRVFSFTHVSNRGAAFGLLQGHLGFFVGIGALVLTAIAVGWWRYRPRQRSVAVSLGLITGGAVGNLIDRVIAGRVTDFLDIHGWPVFNVADMALDIGVAILVFWLLFSPQATPPVREAAAAVPSADDHAAGEGAASDLG